MGQVIIANIMLLAASEDRHFPFFRKLANKTNKQMNKIAWNIIFFFLFQRNGQH